MRVQIWQTATQKQLEADRAAEARKIQRELEMKAQQAGVEMLKNVAVEMMI